MSNSLSNSEKKRFKEIFTDPIKIMILFKILKNPGISSKELKDDLNLKGTKIYYYLGVFEGVHPKTKEKLYKPLIDVVSEETKNHLTMNKYFPNAYLKDIVYQNLMFDLFEDPRENFKWNYIIGINIAISLLQKHLRDAERKSLEDYEENSEYRNLISYNNIAFVKKDVYSKSRDKMKALFDTICHDEQSHNLIEVMKESSHAFVMGATDW